MKFRWYSKYHTLLKNRKNKGHANKWRPIGKMWFNLRSTSINYTWCPAFPDGRYSDRMHIMTAKWMYKLNQAILRTLARYMLFLSLCPHSQTRVTTNPFFITWFLIWGLDRNENPEMLVCIVRAVVRLFVFSSCTLCDLKDGLPMSPAWTK